MVSRPAAVAGCASSRGGATAPVKYRQAPRPSIPMMLTMKICGHRKIRPDSRIPRRLPTMISATNPSPISTR